MITKLAMSADAVAVRGAMRQEPQHGLGAVGHLEVAALGQDVT